MTTAYTGWHEVPEHLRTRTQLADLDLPRIPGGPVVAWIDTRNAIGRRDSFELYNARQSQPSPATAAMLEAAMARRTADSHRCQDCDARTSSPSIPFRPTGESGPHRRLCRACLHISRLRETQATCARRRAACAELSAGWLAADTAAVLEVSTLTPPPGADGRKKPAVAVVVEAVTPSGRNLAALSLRLRRSRHALVPVGALDPDDAFDRLSQVLQDRELIAWETGDLAPIAPALLPEDAAVYQVRSYWTLRTISYLKDPVAAWNAELDPDTGRLNLPLRPGRADRMALLIRRIAAGHTTNGDHPR